MTVLLIVVTFAIIIALAVLYWVRGFAEEISHSEQLLGKSVPVDLLAFRNVTSPEEDEFLRRMLPWRDYVRVRKLRCAAASDYVRIAGYNAALLVRFGQSARATTDARMRRAGSELVSLAVRTRMYAALAQIQLRLAIIVPWWKPSLGAAAATYSQLRNALESVAMLQKPEMATRISSGF